MKLLFINSAALIVSFSQVETVLRLTLLITSIVYTLYKIIDRFDDRKNKKLKKEE
jgi:hypothetical protein